MLNMDRLSICSSCFKVGMMLNTIKLYNVIPLWMILTFTDDLRVTEQLGLVQLFSCKVAWSGSNDCNGWLCEEDDYKDVQ